ncbi:MAG: M48 family metallopeptidase [Notoacmeibacter sp.]
MFGFLRAQKSENLLPETLQVGLRTVALNVVRSTRANRLTLRIGRNGDAAKVTAPTHVREVEIMEFVSRHMGWLGEKLNSYPEKPNLRAGLKVPIKGVAHKIVHCSGRGVNRVVPGETGPELHLHGQENAIARRIADYLKKEAKLTIEPMALKLAAETGKRVKSIRFKDTTSRWGSCSSDGNLSFSWRIMMAPPRVIAYLVAHEVAHLTEMNHGPKFWELCEKLCPDQDACRAWLKRNGSKLQSIGFE